MTHASQTPCLILKNIQRTFYQGDTAVHVLQGIDLTITPGEIVALVGQSGAGKSTLLHIAGLLETPDAGSVVMNGTDTVNVSEDARTRLRRTYAGFVYQAHYLLPEFSALENVMMPKRIAGANIKEARLEAEHVLGELGLSHRLHHRPTQLSGGEQQRVAIARALANHPKIVIADEPTGNLDPKTSKHVFDAFQKLAREKGVAALIATHNMDLAREMTRSVHLRDGVLMAG